MMFKFKFKFTSLVAILALGATSVLGSPAPRSHHKEHLKELWDGGEEAGYEYEVKHAWEDGLPPSGSGWKVHSPAPPDHILNMHIALKQHRFDELVEMLYQVSDPEHHNYGKHLTKEQVDELIAPHPDTTSLVSSWLASHGISSSSHDLKTSSSGHWITLSVPVHVAEKMLDTKYHVFHKPGLDSNSNAQNGDPTYIVRTTSYSLPKQLTGHIDLVTPTTYFGSMKKMKVNSFLEPESNALSDDEPVPAELVQEATAGDRYDFVKVTSDDPTPPNPTPDAVPQSCNTAITPACLIALYNTTGYTPAATDKNSIGIAGYLGEFANNNDLQTFFQRFVPASQGVTFKTVQVNGGGNDQTKPGTEVSCGPGVLSAIYARYVRALRIGSPIGLMESEIGR